MKPISEPILHPTEDNRERLEGSTGIPACVSESTDRNVCATLEESTDRNVCATFVETELNDRVAALYNLTQEERKIIGGRPGEEAR